MQPQYRLNTYVEGQPALRAHTWCYMHLLQPGLKARDSVCDSLTNTAIILPKVGEIGQPIGKEAVVQRFVRR
jgi:hypothetical protein